MKKLLQSLFVFLFIAVSAMAQERTITGVVTGDGQPIPGVSVTVQGSRQGTTTNEKGEFSISAPSNGTLVFNYIGFLRKEVAIAGQSKVNANLTIDSQTLSDVNIVSTGYTSVDRTKSPGAISSISSKAITGVTNPSFDQILQGRAPGLYVTAVQDSREVMLRRLLFVVTHR